ncbi:MAG: hypothetical protein EAX91_00430 [Candidatus Lokiarchaeota archaeon]|nr:hypothetical protein [Candidatus Lokiarchaeota archaeon]
MPMDEDGFIEYDFESSLATTLEKVEMKIIDIYQFGISPPLLVVNISVSKLNSTNNEYEALLVDSIEFANQTCLQYNKTEQYFRYHQSMENLLINGYGGFFLMPCDPVDINLVKGYIDTYTTWSAAIEENTITIDINNDQVVLLYSDQGILIREEVISAGQVVSTLSISIPSEPSISFGGLFPLFFITALIGAIFIKWNTRNR